jgi:23S rRNA pseudouridine2604 synthase
MSENKNDQKKVIHKNDEDMVRLSKVMSSRGLCSRREADSFIEKGQVKVDGEVVRILGSRVDPNCEIEIVGEAKNFLDEQVTIVLHKPRDFVSSQPEDGYTSALDLIREPNYYGKGYRNILRKGLAPLGRLDIDSTGLILYSQSGVLAKKIIGDSTEIEKEYEVNVVGDITEKALKLLQHGLYLDDVELKEAQITKVSSSKMIFVLKQGRKRQIRRMCELVGLQTRRIHRMRVGKLELGDLPEGMWRIVEPHEII